MSRLPQEPSDDDVDDLIDRMERRLVRGTDARERLLTQLELTSLRRHYAKLPRRVRDLDGTILDLRDRLSSYEVA